MVLDIYAAVRSGNYYYLQTHRRLSSDKCTCYRMDQSGKYLDDGRSACYDAESAENAA